MNSIMCYVYMSYVVFIILQIIIHAAIFMSQHILTSKKSQYNQLL